MLPFYLLNAVIHEKETSISRALLYESYGMQISDVLGHTILFGDIGLSRKKT